MSKRAPKLSQPTLLGKPLSTRKDGRLTAASNRKVRAWLEEGLNRADAEGDEMVKKSAELQKMQEPFDALTPRQQEQYNNEIVRLNEKHERAQNRDWNRFERKWAAKAKENLKKAAKKR